MPKKITPQRPKREQPNYTHKRAATTELTSAESGPTEANDTAGIGQEPAASVDAHGIFDERFRLFTDAFGHTCEHEGVSTAVTIVVDPKLPQQPLVFVRGDEYAVAKLLASLLRRLKQQIEEKITP